MKIIKAWWLGFTEHIGQLNNCGLTWDDQDCNEAYDRGWNFADWLRGRSRTSG
jgi:hypothetical protein